MNRAPFPRVLARCLADGDAETGLRICVATSPRWIAWGTFGEGGEWLDSFLALDTNPPVAGCVLGAALVTRAQLALAVDRAVAERRARDGLRLCRDAGDPRWIAAALNVLSETALRAGEAREAVTRADEAVAVARSADDGWNEGYALGTRAGQGTKPPAIPTARASSAVRNT